MAKRRSCRAVGCRSAAELSNNGKRASAKGVFPASAYCEAKPNMPSARDRKIASIHRAGGRVAAEKARAKVESVIDLERMEYRKRRTEELWTKASK